jgi:hypothetical protein
MVLTVRIFGVTPASSIFLSSLEADARSPTCACMYVCMHVCMYVCMHICSICMLYYVCAFACMYFIFYVCIFVCIDVCMYACMYVCMNVCMCNLVNVHVYVQSRICMYMQHAQGLFKKGNLKSTIQVIFESQNQNDALMYILLYIMTHSLYCTCICCYTCMYILRGAIHACISY